MFEASGRHTLEQQLEWERDRQQSLIEGDAFAEGVRAFNERRKPLRCLENGSARSIGVAISSG